MNFGNRCAAVHAVSSLAGAASALGFNPSQRVEGYSNLAWVLLAAGSMAVGHRLVHSIVLGFEDETACIYRRILEP